MAAHDLTQSGVECVLVDRRDVARGSTAASTGPASVRDRQAAGRAHKLVGRHTATRAYQLGVEALTSSTA
jgi:hypothetical protein